MSENETQETSTEFATSAEGSNEQIHADDQAVAVEVKTAFPHKVRHDGVVVLPDVAALATKGGILLPENAANPPLTGRVLAVGPKCSDDIKVGQSVCFSKYSGAELEIKHQGRKVVLLRDEHVRMILGA